MLGPAIAQAVPPAAPYDAYVVDSEALNQVADASNATFTMSYLNDRTLYLTFRTSDSTGNFSLERPIGAPLAVGTYVTQTYRDETHPAMRVEPNGCSGPGQVTITELTWNGGTITSFAAGFTSDSTDSCPGGAKGVVRYHSNQGYQASLVSTDVVNLGRQAIGAPPVSQSITITGRGTEPTTFGVAALTKWDTQSFAITADTCSNATLTVDQTCTITIAPNTSILGQSVSYLGIGDLAGHTKAVRLEVTIINPKLLTFDRAFLNFGEVEINTVSPVETATIIASGLEPVTIGQISLGKQPAGATFTMVSDGCSNRVLAVGTSCQFQATVRPTGEGQQQMALNFPSDAWGGWTPVWNVQGYAKASYYYQLAPQRLLDTRSGLGVPAGIVSAGGVVHLQVTGRGGVPAANVTAVVLNMTVTGPTGAGHLTLYPAGVERPTASALNFTAGWTGANSVTVKLGAGGVVDIYSSNTTHIIADVVGFYTGATAALPSLGIGGQYHMVEPTRLLDTRSDPTVTRLPAFGSVTLGMDFGPAVSSHVRAVAVNITAVSPGMAGYLTAWSGNGSLPNTSTLNFTAGKVVPNMALVPTVPCWLSGCDGVPQIEVYNGSASGVDVIVDIVGYFDDGTVANGLLFRARTPVRLLDTRMYYNGNGPRQVGPGGIVPVSPRGVLPFWSDYSQAVVMNVTGVSPTTDTFLTLWPDGLDRPTVSNLNPAARQIVANASITGIGGMITGFNVFNNAGYTDVVLDVVGTFEPPGSPNPIVATQTTTVSTRTAAVSGGAPVSRSWSEK